MIHWILKNRIPIPVDDVLAWARWYETADRTVAVTDIDPEVRVSTIFLGINHNHSANPEAPPILFETMVFGEEKVNRVFGRPFHYREDLGQWRYHTWAEAEAGHKDVCTLIQHRLDEAAQMARELALDAQQHKP